MVAPVIARLRGRPVARRRRTGSCSTSAASATSSQRDAERASARAARRTRSTVETYLHVREDALQLYGFADADERELFEQLLAVTGVGPKVALAIVSGSPPAELRRAIVREDTARFQAIPGIGKKTAQRVVLELKEKLGRRLPPTATPGAGAGTAPGRARRARRARLLARRRRARARRGRSGAAAGGARPARR